MENRLRQLFDFQKFESNASLQQVIDDVHARVFRSFTSCADASAAAPPNPTAS